MSTSSLSSEAFCSPLSPEAKANIMATSSRIIKATLDTLPNEVLDHIFDDLLRVTDEHCHHAGLTDTESDPNAKASGVPKPTVSVLIPISYK